MANITAVRAKWQRIAAESADPDVKQRAQDVLSQLPDDAPQHGSVGKLADAERQGRISRGIANGTVDEDRGDILGSIGEAFTSGDVADSLGAFGAGVNEKALFGLPSRFLDATGLSPRAEQDMAKAASPTSAAVGNIVGTTADAIGGGAAAVGRGAMGLISRAGLAPMQTAAGVAGITGGVSAGAEAAVRGEDLQATLKQGGEGAVMSSLIGGGMAAAGKAADSAFGVVRNTRGGRARELADKYRDAPELAGKKPNDRDIGEVSRKSSARILNNEESQLERDLAPHLAAKNRLDNGPGMTTLAKPEDLRDELIALSGDGRLSDAQQGTVRSWLARLDKWQRPKAEGLSWPPTEAAIPESELNKLRQLISAKVQGDPGNVPEAILKRGAGLAKDAVDNTAYAGPNARIHEARNNYEARRRTLGLADDPAGGKVSPEGPAESEVSALANMMSRDGQNTVTNGARNADRLNDYMALKPDARADIEIPRSLAARGDLEFRAFGNAQKGGLINRLPELGGVSAGIGASAVTQDPKYAAMALGLSLLGRNAIPIQGRPMYSAAQGLSNSLAYPADMPASPLIMEELYRQAMAAIEAEKGR